MFEVILEKQTPAVAPIEGDVQTWIKNNQDIIKKFLDYAKTRDDAVGLAANQLSYRGERLMLRMYASRAGTSELHQPSRIKDYEGWEVYINPQITKKYEDPDECIEGCLTWPKNRIRAHRHPVIQWEAYTIDGKHNAGKAIGFSAQVMQHEQDHLDGVEEEIIAKDYQTVRSTKIGRNDPCPCGSGRKHKKCCLNK
jgi:peptide deformylase